MELQDFIENNREELTQCIKNVVHNCIIDDEEIENWILNDEGLYNWAINEGVEI